MMRHYTGVWTKFGARERARQNWSHSERGANICNMLATRRMRSNEAAAANRESNLVQSPDYTESDLKIELCQGGALNLSQCSVAEAAKHIMFSDAGGLKCSGCPTPTEAIFKSRAVYLLVNFGGPRSQDEIFPFLKELLCDRDVIRTRFPTFIHNWLFKRVARKRATVIAHDYNLIGGRSPIYFDTENLAKALSERLGSPVLTFHRYLSATHAQSLKKMEQAKEIRVLPLFPQFSYSTTGSIARFLSDVPTLQWIRSYAAHPAFIRATQCRITDFLKEKDLREEEVLFLFSAHGLPQLFVDEGDIYEQECEQSFQAVLKGFPNALGKLCYQSKFGPGEWLKPYTNEVCEQILDIHGGRKNVVFVPISFTSDHIETLFEVEKMYLPIITAKGLNAYRCPALGLEPYWIEALAEIITGSPLHKTKSLVKSQNLLFHGYTDKIA